MQLLSFIIYKIETYLKELQGSCNVSLSSTLEEDFDQRKHVEELENWNKFISASHTKHLCTCINISHKWRLQSCKLIPSSFSSNKSSSSSPFANHSSSKDKFSKQISCFALHDLPLFSFIFKLYITNTKSDTGQPEQNWNNNKIKKYNLGVST